MTVREPVLVTVKIADLRPTQITVGMREVRTLLRKAFHDTRRPTLRQLLERADVEVPVMEESL